MAQPQSNLNQGVFFRACQPQSTRARHGNQFPPKVPSRCFSTFAIASCKSVESTMLYLSKVDSVRCPEILMAILRGTPDLMRFLTPLRRKSCNMTPLYCQTFGPVFTPNPT